MSASDGAVGYCQLLDQPNAAAVEDPPSTRLPETSQHLDTIDGFQLCTGLGTDVQRQAAINASISSSGCKNFRQNLGRLTSPIMISTALLELRRVRCPSFRQIDHAKATAAR